MPRAIRPTTIVASFMRGISAALGRRLTPLRSFVTLAALLMEIKKAIITAAGKNQRTLPLQTLVDRDGVAKTALRIIIEEVLQAGVEEIAVVISPGDQKSYESAAGSH